MTAGRANGWSLASAPRVPPRTDWLAIGLRLLAAIETSWALLQSLQLIAPDVPIAGGVPGLITVAHLIVAPILAVAALIFAARGRLLEAVIALAMLDLTTWASELATPLFPTGIGYFLASIARPIVAVAAIVLAARYARVGLAALLIAGVWLVWAWFAFLGEVLIFFAAVMIYGV